MRDLLVRDVRNIREAQIRLAPGLNVLVGRNAQGKTSVLEAMGLLARGRSFRTDDTAAMVRRGATALLAGAETAGSRPSAHLEVELQPPLRRFRLDGRQVALREYRGRLEVAVYSTARLRVIHGTQRDRRAFLDRAAAALWPGYRGVLQGFERVLAHRNAALRSGGRDLAAWTDRLVALGAELRERRAQYAERLQAAIGAEPLLEGEAYAIRISPEVAGSPRAAIATAIESALAAVASRERLLGQTLAGPHRDTVRLEVDGRDAAQDASSGQARSLLLALVLGTLRVHQEETGDAAVALLDDLDSELDAERAGHVCREVARRGQALVTTAHPAWAQSLRTLGPLFQVRGGEVRPQ